MAGRHTGRAWPETGVSQEGQTILADPEVLEALRGSQLEPAEITVAIEPTDPPGVW
jgi:hypothetical protein